MSESPDPFDSLRRPVVPLDPDPGFAARLRARIVRELRDHTPGDAMTDMPRRQQTLTPYLAVSPAADAIDWYVEVFGAVRLGDAFVMPDGRIGHAELMIGDSLLMLADAYPEIGHTAPTLDAGTHVMLTVQVDDADATVARAAQRGAVVDRPVADTDHGHRGGAIRDPFGHRWSVQSPLRGAVASATREPIAHGDLAYFSLHLPDAERGIAFYSSVLGWTVEPAASGRSAQVQGQSSSGGIWGDEWPGIDRPGVFISWTVDDIEQAVEAVRSSGGTAGEVESRPYGRSVDCSDDQGLGFALHQDHPGSPTPKPTPSRQGDVEYFTIGSPDEVATGRFYSSVLGWDIQPGSTEHGRQVRSVTPIGGLWGGDANRQRVQLMFRVDDMAAATERVRRAGGTATQPERQPYGLSADCVDDQGLAFWLLESSD